MIKSIDSSVSVTNRSLSLSLYFGDLNARSIKKEKLNELYVKYYETKKRAVQKCYCMRKCKVCSVVSETISAHGVEFGRPNYGGQYRSN